MKYSNLTNGVTDIINELGTFSNIVPIQKSIRIIEKPSKLIETDFYLSNAIAANKTHPFWTVFSDYKEVVEITFSEFLLQPIKFDLNRSCDILVVLW